MDFEVAITGAGAAGLSAGIYAARAGMSGVIFDQSMSGGQTINTPLIENYPGFPRISGPELMEQMKLHASEYCEMREFEKVSGIEPFDGGFRLTTENAAYGCKAVILATGARHRKLEARGESHLTGRGVSYCATCDGNFFGGRDVVVVGGGNSAATEALYLHGVGARVSMVHRRDRLRAEDALVESIRKAGIEVHWDSVVDSIDGSEAVTGVTLKNTKDGTTRGVECAGVFIAIGVLPNNELASETGVELDSDGYIRVDGMQRTSVPGVYAAGDITGGLRQIVTGAAEGAQAALSAMEMTGRTYPF